MFRIPVLLWLAAALCLSSCTSVKLSQRSGKDLQLTEANFQQLAGTYLYPATDSVRMHQQAGRNSHTSPHSIRIRPIDARTLELAVWNATEPIESQIVKGRYRRGYFKMRHQWHAKMVFGPLLWVLSEQQRYLGLTRENELVMLNSGGSGWLLLVAWPIMVAGGPKMQQVYKRAD